MAKTLKYNEDILLSAVVRYAEETSGKIKATELAKWCRKNVTGLEEVRNYHFTRSVIKRDSKSGEIIKVQRLCMQKIIDINKSRSIAQRIKANPLLTTSDVESFFQQTENAQRRAVVDTIKMFNELTEESTLLKKENYALNAENNILKEELANLKNKTSIFEKNQNKLAKQITYLMKAISVEKSI